LNNEGIESVSVW